MEHVKIPSAKYVKISPRTCVVRWFTLYKWLGSQHSESQETVWGTAQHGSELGCKVGQVSSPGWCCNWNSPSRNFQICKPSFFFFFQYTLNQKCWRDLQFHIIPNSFCWRLLQFMDVLSERQHLTVNTTLINVLKMVLSQRFILLSWHLMNTTLYIQKVTG